MSYLMRKFNKFVEIYTDGSCSQNPGPGGWAAILKFSSVNIKQISGGKKSTTNNAMELTAALEALQDLQCSYNIDLYTDSVYLQKGMTQWRYAWVKNNWKNSNRKVIKNIELWQKLIKYGELHDIQWFWVKAHSDNYYNNLVDQLAVKETKYFISQNI
ncbi:MAG: ribonuclease HI [Rickettsia sp.]|nr:ribonuclease HI [Rickettsia sp.]